MTCGTCQNWEQNELVPHLGACHVKLPPWLTKQLPDTDTTVRIDATTIIKSVNGA